MTALLTISRAGPLMSVQDNGRYGFRARGVSTSGAMDRDAHAIANALVGNDPHAAAIEFALTGGVFTADRDILIAVTGGSCPVEIAGKPVPAWESHFLKAGETLTVGSLSGAVWGYIAISGGIAISNMLGSRSTHLRTAVGGLNGKALSPGDTLPLGDSEKLSPRSLGTPYLRGHGPIAVIPGPQDDYFDENAWKTFLRQPYRATTARDRMAMVLDGPALHAFKGHDIVSDATVVGSIQVPGSGKPIVLTADGQTTGGYPKIATIASFDLSRLAQLPAGQQFLFRAISADLAEEQAVHADDRLSAAIAGLRNKED
ncbi:biotin-dependent carboxyltransferase family protein [Aliirhizobium cellulosilyticum]|uniref:Allophanate hydrolase n=1 Tax=Aliirhizobium cellulosilyticum TaxID=393664 RepID=A0A7W6V2M8_9HYPH|nr:biotin-dependent carboxyltransferase family protein [Rhizobium cellulosilyticum]MBB4350161.1 allophanate hydrolase [Rhizobium cellulosilyticum]MBB4413339.1 allophanate hydrolase [Rhizobium cellulosilyticum]MBB4447722.1 allophanate hydrolase [Rhizobium cellulosilyticum]